MRNKVEMTGLIYENLYDQYKALDLPTELLKKDKDFTIFDLNSLNRPYPFASPVSRLNFFVFTFVKSAIGEYLVDDQLYPIQPGTIYFTNPGHWRSFNWHSVESVCLITMSEEFLKKYVNLNVFDEFPFLLSETFPGKYINEMLFDEFEELYEQIKKTNTSLSTYRKRIIGSLFSVILLKIKELFWTDYYPLEEGKRSSVIVTEFQRLIKKHFNEMVTGKVKQSYNVQNYANALQLHPNYLNNVIKIKTGRSVSSWIVYHTILEARLSLENTSFSVKELSYMLGFNSSSHFCAYFKKHVGKSPSEYRNSFN